MFPSVSRGFLPWLVPFLSILAIAGCQNGGDGTSSDIPEPRLITQMLLNDRSEVLAEDADLLMDDFEPHEGSASLNIFATALRLTWLWEGPVGTMTATGSPSRAGRGRT